jgi:hypothetical protein
VREEFFLAARQSQGIVDFQTGWLAFIARLHYRTSLPAFITSLNDFTKRRPAFGVS